MTAPPPFWIREGRGIAFSDVPRNPGGRMPDFCIIGAAKCGTSALNKMLDAQPAFYMSPIKESHYFSTAIMLEKGDDWYRGLFSGAGLGQICGEASTSYTRYPLVEGTAARMAAANPRMKLVYIMREPVARTESEALQSMKFAKHVLGEDHSGMALDDFFHMVEDPAHPYYSAIVATGCYIDQIEAFEAHFPPGNMLLLFQDDLRADATAVLKRISVFLGGDPGTLVEMGISRNVTSDWLGGLVREQATEGFRRLPFYDTLKSALPARLKNQLLKVAAAKSGTSKDLKFSEHLHRELHGRFRAPNVRLRDRLGALPEGWSL